MSVFSCCIYTDSIHGHLRPYSSNFIQLRGLVDTLSSKFKRVTTVAIRLTPKNSFEDNKRTELKNSNCCFIYAKVKFSINELSSTFVVLCIKRIKIMNSTEILMSVFKTHIQLLARMMTEKLKANEL